MFSQFVGINTYMCPAHIREKNGALQSTVASVDLLARAPERTSSSLAEAMIQVLGHFLSDVRADRFAPFLAEACVRLQASEVRISMSFPFFIAKQAPVSGMPGLVEYRCALSASSLAAAYPEMRIVVPVTTLCPCSKEISGVGAHNQRAEVTLTAQAKAVIWLEDLIPLLERCGSSEIYALLKREDEKYVTERAYNHPMFVEDVAREVALRIRDHEAVSWFSVGVESFESIHAHSAYAFVDSEDLCVNKNA